MADGTPKELVFTRLIDATPQQVFRCWTEPELMKQWFTPRPWTTPVIETDVRPSGTNYILMKGPDGEEMPNRGVYLEVVPNRKLVFTDAYVSAWEPSAKPFMTGVLTFEPEDGKTRYRAVISHWSEDDKKAHEQMGFQVGWGKATEQMETLLKTM